MDQPENPSEKPSFKPWIDLLKNSLGKTIQYRIRRLSKKQRGTRSEHRETKKDLFLHIEKAEQRKTFDYALELKERYHLDLLWERTSRENLRLNLFYLEMLEKSLNLTVPRLPEIIAAADIGAANWPYVHGLHSVIKWWRSPAGRQLQLTGFERDPYRLNPDHHSCLDHALGHMNGLKDVEYIPKKFKPQPNHYHLITLVFPFVFLEDHLKWGLPSQSFNPDLLFQHAWKSLKPGGVLIIVNQGREQHLAQRNIMLSAGIEPLVGFVHESYFYTFDPPMHLHVTVKDLFRTR